MTSKTNQRRDGSSGVVTQLCSINTTGAVFLSDRQLDMSSEISFNMETHVFGLQQEWTVKGWVVECQPERATADSLFQVTLLFSDLPEGLRKVLVLTEGHMSRGYPVIASAPLFGMN